MKLFSEFHVTSVRVPHARRDRRCIELGHRAREPLYGLLLLFAIIGGLVVLGTNAYHAWKANLPWLGWGLRRRQRSRSSERESR